MTPRTFSRMVLGACFCLVMLGQAAAEQAPRDKAKAHFVAGEAKYKAGDYAGAIVDFRAADALVPSPILAFNIAICHDKLGQLEDAVSLYRDYLARQPNVANAGQVNARIAELEAQLQAKAAAAVPPPAPEPTDVVDVADPPQPDGAPVAVTPAPRRYDDALARRVPGRGAVAAASQTPYSEPQPGEAAPPAASAPMPPDRAPEPEKKSTPVYKQWWFWVVVGVSVLILVDVATGPDNNDDPQPGAVILRF